MLENLPQHIVSEIVCAILADTSLSSSLRLRLVCQLLNKEVLHAFFNLHAPNFRKRWPYGYIIPFDSLAMVRYLHGLASRPSLTTTLKYNHAHWRNTIEEGASMLQQLLPEIDLVVLQHERRVPVEHRGVAEWVYRRVMCEAIVGFLGPEECFRSLVCDEVSMVFGDTYPCILNRPTIFWVVVACCRLGSYQAVKTSIFAFRETVEETSNWRVQLNGCMYVAAKHGHVDIVRLLVDMGLDVNGRAYRGFSAFVDGDGTALGGAAKYGSFELVEFLLAQHVVREGPTYDWAIHECLRHKDKLETRLLIFRRLLEDRKEWGNRLELRERLLSRAYQLRYPELVSVILEHGVTDPNDDLSLS